MQEVTLDVNLEVKTGRVAVYLIVPSSYHSFGAPPSTKTMEYFIIKQKFLSNLLLKGLLVI